MIYYIREHDFFGNILTLEKPSTWLIFLCFWVIFISNISEVSDMKEVIYKLGVSLVLPWQIYNIDKTNKLCKLKCLFSLLSIEVLHTNGPLFHAAYQ